MIETYTFAQTLSAAVAVSFPALGTSLGQLVIARQAIASTNTQPWAKALLLRAEILGMALVETSAVIGITGALLILLALPETRSVGQMLAKIGIGAAIGIPGFMGGLTSALPAQDASISIARQPFESIHATNLMLMTQSFLQTPIIFGFVVAVLIMTQYNSLETLFDGSKALASGLCIGLGSIGPSLGLAQFAKQACASIGINKYSFNKIFSFTLVSEAIIETPLIFALLVSILILVGLPQKSDNQILRAIGMLSAAVCSGIGAIMPSISSGRTAGAAAKQIAIDPEKHGTISKLSLLAQGLIDTFAIYALIVSLLIITA